MGAILDMCHVTRIIHDGPEPVTLVEDVTLAIKPAEFVAITGASGSGKSSLMYLMGLLDAPSSGEIWLKDVATQTADAATLDRLRLEHVGFIFQFHFLLPEFSAMENILLPMRKIAALSEPAMQARAKELLLRFGLEREAHKRPAQLSGGQRQRVAIARALANRPALLLADEPTGNLDSHNAEAVFTAFEHLVSEEGSAVVVITHDETLAQRTHRRVVMRDGRVEG